MGAGVATEFWSFAGRAPGNKENEPFLDFMLTVGNTSDAEVPKVFSTSYGECENTVGAPPPKKNSAVWCAERM